MKPLQLCESCGEPLCPGGRKATGVCAVCRRGATRFLAEWAEDLRSGGLSWPQVAEIVGVPTSQVRARVSERRRRLAAA